MCQNLAPVRLRGSDLYSRCQKPPPLRRKAPGVSLGDTFNARSRSQRTLKFSPGKASQGFRLLPLCCITAYDELVTRNLHLGLIEPCFNSRRTGRGYCTVFPSVAEGLGSGLRLPSISLKAREDVMQRICVQ